DDVTLSTTLPQLESPFGSRPAGFSAFTDVYVPTGSVAMPVTAPVVGADAVRVVADGVVGISTVVSRSDPQADAIPAAASSISTGTVLFIMVFCCAITESQPNPQTWGSEPPNLAFFLRKRETREETAGQRPAPRPSPEAPSAAFTHVFS